MSAHGFVYTFMYILVSGGLGEIGAYVLSQISGPDLGPDDFYLYLSGLENLNCCTFPHRNKFVFICNFVHNGQFHISAFSSMSDNNLISQCLI